MTTAAVIVAAGRSERFGGDVPKQFREIAGKPMLSWTISRFEAADSINNIVVVTSEQHLTYTSERVVDPYGFPKVTKVVQGGDERRKSVLNGLEALPISTKFVAIHDAARPLVTPEDIDRVVEQARKERAAILAVPAADTVKRAKDGYILATLDRKLLYLAQTPQVFQYDLIIDAHRAVAADDPGFPITDDASLIEARGFKVTLVEPSGPNLKVTTRDDFKMAAMLLSEDSHE